MKIKMCAFIPRSLGTSLSMCALPRGLSNQHAFDADVRSTSGTWLREPNPSLVFCGCDNREFGNTVGTNRLSAYNDIPLNLVQTGNFQLAYGKNKNIFEKRCDVSKRAFVQTSNHPLSIREMERSPLMHFHGGGRFPVFQHEREYGYIHLQQPERGSVENNFDIITDVNSNYSKIEVNASAGYPYLEPFAPNIDFNFTIHVRRNAYNYDIEIIGSHNEFPCYELFINGLSLYRFKTKYYGPTPFNLNETFSFTIKKQFLK